MTRLSGPTGPDPLPDDFDAWLDDALSALPLMSPREGFGDRIMARVALPDPFGARALRALPARWLRPRSLPAAAMLLVMIGSMAASALWTVGHQQTLLTIGDWLGTQASSAAWFGIFGAASTLLEQPWFGGLREFAASPVRLATTSALVMAVYAAGVITLRRLLSPPARQVAHAGL
ncbi:MAG: hypothetical protein H0W67_10775 [Gemmatimonadales bacterium]|nr:hypothetical protein [Gemmatimonadales bacterium]